MEKGDLERRQADPQGTGGGQAKEREPTGRDGRQQIRLPSQRLGKARTIVNVLTQFCRRFVGRGSTGFCIRGSEGKGRSFVEQDKGPAVPCGIFDFFLNELTAFFSENRSLGAQCALRQKCYPEWLIHTSKLRLSEAAGASEFCRSRPGKISSRLIERDDGPQRI